MLPLEDFEIRDGCGYYRPAGATTPGSYIELLRRGLEACRESQVKQLLLDSTKLSGPQLSVTQRYGIVSEVVKFWDMSIKLAIVNPPDVNPPDDFAETVARNRGLQVAIFTSEPAALAWLGG